MSKEQTCIKKWVPSTDGSKTKKKELSSYKRPQRHRVMVDVNKPTSKALHDLVKKGYYPSISEFVREAIKDSLIDFYERFPTFANNFFLAKEEENQ